MFHLKNKFVNFFFEIKYIFLKEIRNFYFDKIVFKKMNITKKLLKKKIMIVKKLKIIKKN